MNKGSQILFLSLQLICLLRAVSLSFIHWIFLDTSVDKVVNIVIIDFADSFNCSTSVLLSIKLSWSPCGTW